MYDPDIYRHQISEYYNPYVLDAEIQAGEFNSDSAGFELASFLLSWLKFFFKKNTNKTPQLLTTPIQFAYVELHPPQMSYIASLDFLKFSVSDIFWCILGDTRSARSWNTPDQGAGNTGNRCLLFRLVQTQSDFRPMGFCWQRCFTFSTHQLFWILPQSIWNWGRLSRNVPSMTPQQEAGKCFTLIDIFTQQYLTVVVHIVLGGCSSFAFECSKPDI